MMLGDIQCVHQEELQRLGGGGGEFPSVPLKKGGPVPHSVREGCVLLTGRGTDNSSALGPCTRLPDGALLQCAPLGDI